MQQQHITSTPYGQVPVVRERREMLPRPTEGFTQGVNEYRKVYSSAPVIAAPHEQMTVVLTGTQPELEKLFSDRYQRAVRMNAAKQRRAL